MSRRAVVELDEPGAKLSLRDWKVEANAPALVDLRLERGKVPWE